MAVTGDGEGIRERITFLNENLMADASARRIEVYTVLPREGFNRRVLGQIFFGSVLYVMVQCKDELGWVVYSRGTNRFEPEIL